MLKSTIMRNNIPKELKDLKRWNIWQHEDNNKKVPYDAVTGTHARPNDEKGCHSFEEAFEVYKNGKADGVNFLLCKNDPYTVIDLDNCLDDAGNLTPWAEDIVSRLNSYVEVSPSGHGLHIFVKLTDKQRVLENHTTTKNDGKIEYFTHCKYFTVTGCIFQERSRIETRQHELEELLTDYFPQENSTERVDLGPLPDYAEIQKALLAANEQIPDIHDFLFGRWSEKQAENLDRSGKIYELACRLVESRHFKELRTIAVIVYGSSLHQSKYGDRSEKKCWEQAVNVTKRALNRQTSKRPEICANEQNLDKVTTQAIAALENVNSKNSYLFLHGGPVRIEPSEDDGLIAVTLTPDRLRHELAKNINWVKLNKDEQKQPAKPPVDVAKNILASPRLPFPVLTTITYCPTFAPDGTLEMNPGYNPKTKTYFDCPDDLKIPLISEHPSKKEIERAKDFILSDLFIDFPFTTDADRAHAVALFLLPFVRPMVEGPTPLHLVEASTQGSGKGLFTSVALYPSLGRNVAVVAPPKDDEEFRKAITSRLREGRQVVLLDNVYRLDSCVLAAALTADTWDDRVLGKNETVTIPIQWVWVATGNNAIVSTDITRRSIRIRLTPQVERPWLRKNFKHSDLRKWVSQHRTELMWAGLTLIQAWIAAGKPKANITILGSFENWSLVIGSILQYIGINGFLDNILEFYEVADTESEIWKSLIDAWWYRFKNKPVMTKDILELIMDIPNLEFDLGAGLTERSQKIHLGMKLAQYRDRVFGNYQIRAGRLSYGNKTWFLQKLEVS